MQAVAVVPVLQKDSTECCRKPIPRLGVGISYSVELPTELLHSGAVDFVEITAQSVCDGSELDPNRMDQIRRLCGRLPIVLRRDERSEDSRTNRAYLDLLDSFCKEWAFAWHSEPQSSSAKSIDLLERRFGAPFLFDADREIARGGGPWRSLDLHSLDKKSHDAAFDPFDAIDNMALNAVGEIRVNGEVRVWDLLDYVLPLCPNVGGIVVDAVQLGAIRLRSELGHARYTWARMK